MNFLWHVAPRHTGKVTTSFIFLHGLGLTLFFHDMLGPSIGDWPNESKATYETLYAVNFIIVNCI